MAGKNTFMMWATSASTSRRAGPSAARWDRWRALRGTCAGGAEEFRCLVGSVSSSTKMNAMEIIEWIQAWYLDQCDGHWEHQYGMVIETLDNPGWSIRVELEGTDYAIPDETWKQ